MKYWSFLETFLFGKYLGPNGVFQKIFEWFSLVHLQENFDINLPSIDSCSIAKITATFTNREKYF